jgi:hypothetical protein
MNRKSLIITIIVAFITVRGTDFLIHGVWLSSDYAATLKFAFLMGLMSAAGQIIMYAFAPRPDSLVAKWCVAYLLQALVLGLVVHKVYRLPA